jgi:transcriptional regulator with XRE-family HTH domain
MNQAATTLKRARRQAGLSQERLALLAGVPQSTVGRIEAGLTVPRLDTWQRLLGHCGWSLEAAPVVQPREQSTPDLNAVPGFMWDSDMTWGRFLDALHHEDPDVRGWAYSRLLSEARWDEIWSAVTPEDVAENLDLTHFRAKPIWEHLVDSFRQT